LGPPRRALCSRRWRTRGAATLTPTSDPRRTVDDELNAQLFFHVSEVQGLHKPVDSQRPDLRRALRPGDEVGFTIDPSKYNDGRLHAKQVHKLAPGTLKLLEVDPERRRGVAEFSSAGALVIAYRADPASGHPPRHLAFNTTGDGARGREAVEVGDSVEFCIMLDRLSQLQRATDVEVVAKAFSELYVEGQLLV